MGWTCEEVEGTWENKVGNVTFVPKNSHTSSQVCHGTLPSLTCLLAITPSPLALWEGSALLPAHPQGSLAGSL